MHRPVSWLATLGLSPNLPAFSRLKRNGVWADKVAYSCGGSRGLAVDFTVSRIPVSALSGHRSMGEG